MYFVVVKLGDFFLDGKMDMNFEGLIVVMGKWVKVMVVWFYFVGFLCKVLDVEEFKKLMFEKLIWICVFMLVGVRYLGVMVGVVEKEYWKEVEDFINEFVGVVEVEK